MGIQEFLYALILSGFTVQKQAVSFRAWNNDFKFVIQPTDSMPYPIYGAWEIARIVDGWEAEILPELIVPISEFHLDFYSSALTGV